LDSCFPSEFLQLQPALLVKRRGRPLLIQKCQRNRFVNGWPSTSFKKHRKQHNANGACYLAVIRPLGANTTNSPCDHPLNFDVAGTASIRVERDDLSCRAGVVARTSPAPEEDPGAQDDRKN
jgi:hypothetical protein